MVIDLSWVTAIKTFLCFALAFAAGLAAVGTAIVPGVLFLLSWSSMGPDH